MPGRRIQLVTDGIYHVFNKTIEGKKIFSSARVCWKFLEILRYYRSSKATVCFSRLTTIDKRMQSELSSLTENAKYFNVDILAYCLMPTHYHLLFQQKIHNGVQKVMSDVINSFTRYFNVASDRIGPLFLPRFKAVAITTDEQLMHVSRYIHLNPYSSGIVQHTEDLQMYKYSSYAAYLGGYSYVSIQNDKVMQLFGNNRERYHAFVINNAEHQKTLEYMKYLEA